MTAIDDKRLEEIEERAGKATKGQWCAEGPCVDALSLPVSIGRSAPEGKVLMRIICNSNEDAAFIAACREDIPDLLAALREAQAENGRLREALEQIATEPQGMHSLLTAHEHGVLARAALAGGSK